MSFKDFIHKYKMKNKATSSIKDNQILCSIGLNNVGKYLRDGPFKSDTKIVNIHPSKGRNWVAYMNENYFGSNGCMCPKELSNFIIKRNRYYLYSECKIEDLTKKRFFLCKLLFIHNLFDKNDRYSF